MRRSWNEEICGKQWRRAERGFWILDSGKREGEK
jgi:hypothetical protein